jgi:hypothetical protein
VYVGGTWIAATFTAGVSGTIHSPALVFYIALPISAAWLLGYGAAIWFAAAGLLSTLAMVVMDLSQVSLPIYFPNRAVSVSILQQQAAEKAMWPVDQGIFANNVEFAPSRSRLPISAGGRYQERGTGDKIASATGSGHLRTAVQKL